MVGTLLGDGWDNVWLWLVQFWVMVGAVGTMLAYGWNNIGLWLAQCWFIVG